MSEPLFQVLLIDDDVDDLEIVSSLLELQGIRTKCFDSGAKAFFYLQLIEDVSLRPGLIVLDYNMPRVNGEQILILLKNNKDIKDIPVVMYSTTLSAVLKKALSDLGAFECITKATSYTGLQAQAATFRDMVHSFTTDKNLA